MAPEPLTAEWLWREYWLLGKGQRQIAEENGLSPTAVYRLLRRHQIPARPRGIPPNHVALTPTAVAFLEGELLGDGCLVPTPRGHSVRYVHSSKFRDYIRWLADTLASFGIAPSGQIRQRSRHNHAWYDFQTRSYRELRPLYDRWYPDGRKHIPDDLVITPLLLRQFFLGDGSCCRHGNGYQVYLYCNCYPWEEVAQLAEKIARAIAVKTDSIYVQSSPYGPRIYFGQAVVVQRFFDYIGPCPISCYQYKWPD